jgi:hypothetical protein
LNGKPKMSLKFNMLGSNWVRIASARQVERPAERLSPSGMGIVLPSSRQIFAL